MRWLLVFIIAIWAGAAQAQTPSWLDPSYRANEALLNSGVSSAATGSTVLCTGTCNLYALQVTSSTTAGRVLLFNTTTVPADGTVAPVKCWVLAANSTLDKFWGIGPPLRLVTGAVAVYSSAADCFTKTLEGSAFISYERVLSR